ncbi:MAG: hypothetical protein JWO26_18, partial [Rhodospirillales bacterium]|nr:hypothetical protein [Rhodospirillales bacterium]
MPPGMPNQSQKLTDTSGGSTSSEQSDYAGPQALSVYPDAEFVARLLAGMPPDIASSFSERQLFSIQQAL